MAANYDLVVVHGPPSHAVTRVLKQRLLDEDEVVHVCPPQLYQDNPGFGVRDVANNVIRLLRKHKKVVVEDSSAAGAVRDCLLKVIPQKVSACTVHLIELEPRHGVMQVMWERQFFLATSPQLHHLQSDESLLRWFDERGAFVSSSSASVEIGHCESTVCFSVDQKKICLSPAANDAAAPVKCSKETVTVNLTAASRYKFEVPALLMQWECVVDSGGCLEPKVKAACQRWSEANPCGRVVLLADGNNVAKGVLSASQEKDRIISCTRALANELPRPVYVAQLTSILDAGEFGVPPNPGLLAFLHQRHRIDLHHRSTVYIYSDVRHMKMSEKAGVRHIKIGKVLKNPQMMSSCHGATVNPIPEMLRQLEVVVPDPCSSGDGMTPKPTIPLADRLEDFADHHICVDHPHARREFVFAKDVGVLQSFQTLYADCATPVGESGSRMAGRSEQPKTPQRLEPSISSIGATLAEETSTPAQLRQIPKWMLGRRGSSSGSASTLVKLEKSSSNSSVEGGGRSRHTIYIMTEKELLETAKDILKQAGREDMIPTSDVVSAGTVDPGGAKKDIQDSSAPATVKRHAGAASADVSKSVEQNACDAVETTAAETKKQRLEPGTAVKAAQLSGVAADVHQRPMASPARDQSKTTSPHLAPKSAKRKPAPDLSILDEIFS